MMSDQSGGTAFPIVRPDGSGVQYFGMSLRDYFAAKAMQAMISTAGVSCLFGLEGAESDTAKAAYRVANAMIEARSK